MQNIINQMVKIQRMKTFAGSGQLTLGDLITRVEEIATRKEQMAEKYGSEVEVLFDFEYLRPTTINSWRGSYDELAIGFTSDAPEMEISAFLQMLKDTVGRTFTGYKGGDFVMSESTPVWVANYGNSGNTAVIGVLDRGYDVIIETGYREF